MMETSAGGARICAITHPSPRLREIERRADLDGPSRHVFARNDRERAGSSQRRRLPRSTADAARHGKSRLARQCRQKLAATAHERNRGLVCRPWYASNRGDGRYWPGRARRLLTRGHEIVSKSPQTCRLWRHPIADEPSKIGRRRHGRIAHFCHCEAGTSWLAAP